MPCVCGNGHIIRCAEENRVSHDVQKTILHLTALKTVHENAEALQLGIHVHACQRHTIPRLLPELAFVDPPAVDGRQTIDDASTDREFRVGGQFREMNRDYGKLADWVCDGSGALLATAYRTEVSNSDDTVRLNNQHSRGLTVGHAAHAVGFNRRPILSRQNVLALFRIPTASTNRAEEPHEYQRSGFDDGEPFAVVQGYGIPQSIPFIEQTHWRSGSDAGQRDTPERHVRIRGPVKNFRGWYRRINGRAIARNALERHQFHFFHTS